MLDMLKPEALEWVRSLLPMISGGLAGSILTYFLHRRRLINSTPRLAVREVLVDYTLPDSGSDFKFEDLSVAFKGKNYEDLLLYNLDIRNTSEKTVEETPFVITLQEKATILAEEAFTSPVRQEVTSDTAGLEGNAVRYAFGKIMPGDSAHLKMLIAGPGPAGCHFRGSDKVEILTGVTTSAATFEDDLKQSLYLLALYILAGAVPEIAAILRAGIVMTSFPLVLRIYNHVRASFYPAANSTSIGPIVYSDTGTVFISQSNSQSTRGGLIEIGDPHGAGSQPVKNVTSGADPPKILDAPQSNLGDQK